MFCTTTRVHGKRKTSFTKFGSTEHLSYTLPNQSSNSCSNPQRATVLSHLDNVDCFLFAVFAINKRMHSKTGYWSQSLN